MLGMFLIGITVAVAGQWSGPLRAWPVIAETWAVVTVASKVLFGDQVADWVGGGHLLIGYAVLGLLIAGMPERTGAV